MSKRTRPADRYATPELCAEAVAQDGLVLRYVPRRFVTGELCTIAVAQNGLALLHVPRRLKTIELCSLAVTQTYLAFYYVPKRLKTVALCTIAVTQNGMVMLYVPERLKTVELCAIAVRQDVRALKCVPDRFRTDALKTLLGEAIATSTFTLYRRPTGLYQAGCRKHLTLEQALEHWGPPRDDERARVFHAALLGEQRRLAAQGEGQAA
jgi:hypothetical protein